MSGLVVTKLDGTPKGGIVVAIKDELGIPIRYIGVGEGVEDLKVFDSEQFVEALLDTDVKGVKASINYTEKLVANESKPVVQEKRVAKRKRRS